MTTMPEEERRQSVPFYDSTRGVITFVEDDVEQTSTKTQTTSITEVEKKSSSLFYTSFLVISTFIVSIGLLNVTKWIYVTYHFKHALWLTATHMLASYLVATIMIFYFGYGFMKNQSLTKILNSSTKEHQSKPRNMMLSFQEQVRIVAPFSLLGAASIACGNLALVYVFPSFHEMMQSTTVLWTVLFGIYFASKDYNTAAYLCLIPVILGGSLCTLHESSPLPIIGIIISLSSSIFRALRALAQEKLLRGRHSIDSISLLFYAAPFNLCLFLLTSVIVEGLTKPWYDFYNLPKNGKLWILLGSVMASLFNLFSYLLIADVGAVYMQIISQLKTPTIIILSSIIFGNTIGYMQWLGFFIATLGVYGYNKWGEEKFYDVIEIDDMACEIDHESDPLLAIAEEDNCSIIKEDHDDLKSETSDTMTTFSGDEVSSQISRGSDMV